MTPSESVAQSSLNIFRAILWRRTFSSKKLAVGAWRELEVDWIILINADNVTYPLDF